MSNDSASRPNKGSQALGRVMAERDLSQADVMRDLGLSAGVVTRWLTGERKPDLKRRLDMLAKYGIAITLWDEAADAASPDKSGSHAAVAAEKTGTAGV